MAPPQILAFPPTSIRAVSAGAIVGNPVGSSGTRAKALTSAELKAIVEASGPAFLPLSGGTLTGALSLGGNGLTAGAITASGVVTGSQITSSSGNVYFAETRISRRFSGVLMIQGDSEVCRLLLGGITSAYPSVKRTGTAVNFRLADDSADAPLTAGAITASGNLTLRNGLTAMTAEIFETYTSATNYGSLCLKATASGHQIGSARGSAGGSNRAVQLGHFDAAGTFTSGLSVATSGLVSLPMGFDSVNVATIARHVASITSGNNIGNSNAVLNLSYAGADAGRALLVNDSSYNTGGISVAKSTGSAAANTNISAVLITGTFTHSDAGSAGSIGNGLRVVATNNTASSGIVFGANISATANVGSATGLRVAATSTSGTAIAIDAVGQFRFTPASSAAINANGQFSIEMTSNTAGNLVYRGSDGTTRRMALVFA